MGPPPADDRRPTAAADYRGLALGSPGRGLQDAPASSDLLFAARPPDRIRVYAPFTQQRDERQPHRVVGPPGLDLPLRYNANCLRRNRFSVASCARERNMDEANRRTSAATQRICGGRRGNGTGSYRPMVRPQGSQRLILFTSTWARSVRRLRQLTLRFSPGDNFLRTTAGVRRRGLGQRRPERHRGSR